MYCCTWRGPERGGARQAHKSSPQKDWNEMLIAWRTDAHLQHNTTVTLYRGIEVEDWRNKKCFPDPPKFVRSGNLDLCVWLGFCSGLSSCPALPCCRVICSCCESWFCAEFSSNCGDTATSGWDEHQTLQKCIHSPARSCSLIRSYRGNTITAGRDRNWDLGSCQPLVCSKLPAGCLLCSLQAAVVRSHRMGRALQHCSGVLVRRLGGAPLHAASAHHLQPHCKLLHALQGRGGYIDSAGVDI